MACTATQIEYNQMAEGILHNRYKSLGAGSYGTVYHIGDYIVKKVIIVDEDAKDNFHHEVMIWSSLTAIPEMRPYIPVYCSFLLIDNVPPIPSTNDYSDAWYEAYKEWKRKYGEEHYAYGFIFQQYEPVITLYDFLMEAQRAPFSADMSYLFMKDILHAFTLLHKAGIVHRDIKTDNILIRPDATPIIIDFGLACRLFDENGKRESCEDSVAGVPDYNPQEYLNKGERKRVPRIFSNQLQSVKRGLLWNTRKPIRVKVNGVAEPINTPASDMYTLSMSVLRPLVQLTDWSGNRRYERWARRTIQRYEAAIVPQLAASVARAREERNSTRGGARRRASVWKRSRRDRTRRKSSRS